MLLHGNTSKCRPAPMLCFSDRDREILRTSTSQSLAEELERRRRALLEAVSEKYLSIIGKCKLIKEYDVETNIARVKEIACRIMSGDEALRSNGKVLSKVDEIVEQVSLLLKIIRALVESNGDLYEMMGKLMFVKEKRPRFRHNKFYNVVDRLYKSRLVSLSKRVEGEIEGWQGGIKSASKSIHSEIIERIDGKRGRESAIFNAMCGIRPMLCLPRVLVPLYVSREFNFSADPLPERWETTEEMLSFALCFAFIKEKGFAVRGLNYSAMDVSQVRLTRRLFEKMGTCYQEVEDAEKKMCMEILRTNEHLLETSAVEYADACRDAGCFEEQAEIIDAFFCRKLAFLERNVDSVEGKLENLKMGGVESIVLDKDAVPDVVEKIRRDLARLKSMETLFGSYRWSCENMTEKFVKRAEQSVFQAKKTAICKICDEDGDLAQAIIRELCGVDRRVSEMLCVVVRDGLRKRMAGDEKTRRRVVGDALVVVKYYRDNNIPADALEELLR